MLLLLCFFAACSYGIYQLAIVPIFYWKKRGVPHNVPFPIVGNFAPVMLRRTSFYDFQEQIYKDFPNHRYNGLYQLTTPALIIRDLDLIKEIGVKQFDRFMDHRPIGTEHELLFKNLFSIKGNEWRHMRAFLSPAFTSSKIRGMSELMAACARRLTNYYVEMTNNMNQKQVNVELKDLFSRYANDVIATCVFGLECDSLMEKQNEFYLTGKESTNFGGVRGMKMLLTTFTPKLCKFLGLEIFSKNSSDFFINIITDTIAYREANNVTRPDIIHLLLEGRKGKLKHDNIHEDHQGDQGFAVVEESNVGKQDARPDTRLSDVDIASQCFVFFFAGFDTESTSLSFTFTELALNPDIQARLYDEIDQAMTQLLGRPSYDIIMQMKYLDMVVSESLRLWPPGSILERVCTKEFTIEPKRFSEVAVTIKVGELVGIPVLGLHRDAKYFPEPERFDPERFSDANKHKIVPYTYLPFGIGPRACIGSRFALLEKKYLLVYLLHNFEVVIVDKSVVPIVLNKKGLRIAPKGGFWVGLKRRV